MNNKKPKINTERYFKIFNSMLKTCKKINKSMNDKIDPAYIIRNLPENTFIKPLLLDDIIIESYKRKKGYYKTEYKNIIKYSFDLLYLFHEYLNKGYSYDDLMNYVEIPITFNDNKKKKKKSTKK